MAIKITLIVLFIILILVFAGLAIWKWYQRVEDSDEHHLVTPIIFTVLSLLSLIAVICIPGNIHQVNTGEVAVVRHMGTVTGIRNPGVYWDWYFTNDYEIYDTKVISINFSQEETASYSKDNQVISFDLNIQYRIPNNEVKYVAENIGSTGALKDVISPKMLDATKTVIGTKSAEEIIQLRETVATVIKDSLSTPFVTDDGKPFITITGVNIKNIEFTDDFEAAVAAKVAEEQKKQQALIEQERQLAEAENNHKIAVENAKAEAEAAQERANAEAEVARIKAEADQKVAKIEADTALYAGQKNAAIAIQKLAGINGWSVVTITEDPNNTPDYSLDDIITYKLVKYVDNDYVAVTADELAKGVEKLIEVYKYEAWDGALPTYQMGSNGTIAVVTP